MTRRILTAGALAITVLAVLSTGALAAPTGTAPVKVSGTQRTIDFAHGRFAMQGSLVGAWQITGGAPRYQSLSVQLAVGTVSFTGCLDTNRSKACDAGEPAGTLHLSYTLWAEFNPKTKAFLRGNSIEAVTGGTGAFARAKGAIGFTHGATGTSSYRGELLLA